MTKSKAIKSIQQWCKIRVIVLNKKPRHVHPIAYVIGYAAPQCLIVAEPWMDSEKHLQEFDKRSPLISVNLFDASLRAGDWCITAYISREGVSENIAIPIPNEEKPE